MAYALVIPLIKAAVDLVVAKNSENKVKAFQNEVLENLALLISLNLSILAELKSLKVFIPEEIEKGFRSHDADLAAALLVSFKTFLQKDDKKTFDQLEYDSLGLANLLLVHNAVPIFAATAGGVLLTVSLMLVVGDKSLIGDWLNDEVIPVFEGWLADTKDGSLRAGIVSQKAEAVAQKAFIIESGAVHQIAIYDGNCPESREPHVPRSVNEIFRTHFGAIEPLLVKTFASCSAPVWTRTAVNFEDPNIPVDTQMPWLEDGRCKGCDFNPEAFRAQRQKQMTDQVDLYKHMLLNVQSMEANLTLIKNFIQQFKDLAGIYPSPKKKQGFVQDIVFQRQKL